MKLFDKTILVISPEAWGESFVSKHHYALMLAKSNNQVFFSGPPDSDKEVFTKNSGLHPNLHVINYKPIIRGTNRLPGFLRDKVNHINIKRLLSQIDEHIDIVWSFDPYRFQNLKMFGAAINIYHSVDVHHTPREMEIVDSADIVFSTAQKILEKFSHIDTPQYFINHGLADHFLSEYQLSENVPGKSRNLRVGYVGNMHYQHLDGETLKEIVSENIECDFHFIGPYHSNNLSSQELNNQTIEWLKNQPNAFLWGALPSHKLPAAIGTMDMFMMCYKTDNRVAEMANPHKILEYLSTGKVVVSHYIDEYSQHSDLLEMVNNNQELPKLFKQVKANLKKYNSAEKISARTVFAKSNTYQDQLVRVENHLVENGLM